MTRVLLVALAILTVSGVVNYCQYRQVGALNARVGQVTTERDTALEDARQAHADQVIANQASQGFHDELNQLKSAAALKPAPRVDCVRRSAAAVSPVPDANSASGSPATAASTGEVPPADGRTHDLGPPLFALADDCDAVSAQLRGLEAFISGEIAARNH